MKPAKESFMTNLTTAQAINAINNILQGNVPKWILDVAVSYPALAVAYATERRERARMENFLFDAREAADDDGRSTDGLDKILERVQDSNPDSDSWIRKGQVAGKALNRWGARPQTGNVEYGIIEEESTLAIEGDTHEAEMARFEQDGPSLFNVEEVIFENRIAARAYAKRIKAQQGRDYLGGEIRVEAGIEKFVVKVLIPETNWNHVNSLKAIREDILSSALSFISKAKNRRHLNIISKRVKIQSTFNQLLKNGRTVKSERFAQQNGLMKEGLYGKYSPAGGLDYRRFAQIMNAIAARAAELGLAGFRTYKLNTFDSVKSTHKSEDILDRGCQEGEFKATQKADENCDSLWERYEDRYLQGGKFTAPNLTFRMTDKEILDWQSGSYRSCRLIAA
jgi:hypothetical protein